MPLAPVPEFWITLANYIGLYTLVALGLVLLTGIAGQTSFGQAAFVGLGAYTAAYLTLTYGVSPWLTVWIGLAITALAALVLAWVTLRMSGHYLPLATIAWGLSLYYLLGNLDFLGKYDGLPGIPALSFFGISLEHRAQLLLPALDHRRARARWRSRTCSIRAPAARLRAVKGGSTMAEAMGIDTFRVKVDGVRARRAAREHLRAGCSRTSSAPSTRRRSASTWASSTCSWRCVGGVGYVWGALVGASVVQILKDQLQVLLPKLMGTSGNYEIIVFGVLLVLMLQYARDGIWAFVDAALPRLRRKVDWADAAPLPARPRPPHGEVVLDVRAARKEFGGLVAVNDVSFQVRAGEILGLIGPNGAGKSTTFNLVTGVLPATRGEVVLLGQRIDALPSREIARRGVARTFQHVKMIAAMTVLENVALGAHLRGRHGVPAAMLRTRPRRGAPPDEARPSASSQRIGMGELMHEQAGNLAARPAAPDGDRPGARRRSDAAAARRAGGGVAPQGEARPRDRAAAAARRGVVDPAGRARHGSGDGACRSRRRDGVRDQADRGDA